MNRFPPSVSPATFMGSAIAVGFLLTNDFTISEQNAIGQWFTLIADILQTNAAWLDVLIDRKVIYVIDEDDASQDADTSQSTQTNTSNETNTKEETSDLDFLKNALLKMQQEIDNISKNIK